jgi:hypothetical protein
VHTAVVSVYCPTCAQPLPVVPTPERPRPLPDPALELTVRLVADGAATARAMAGRLHGTTSPDLAQLERARRRLAAGVRAGVLQVDAGTGRQPARYRLAAAAG